MRKGIEIEIAADDRARLKAIVADRHRRQKHVERARIVLLTGEGLGRLSIMRQVGCAKATVWRWQERFASYRRPARLRRGAAVGRRGMSPGRRYAELFGWRVLPCWPGTKKAIAPHTEASADPAVIEAWGMKQGLTSEGGALSSLRRACAASPLLSLTLIRLSRYAACVGSAGAVRYGSSASQS